MGGGLQRAVGAAKGHAFAMKFVDGTEVCIKCDVTVESCARRKTRCKNEEVPK